VGCCGLKPSGIAPSIYEAGFQLRPDHWGKGFALEALRGVVAHAFGAIGATALTAGHHPENDRSRGILSKAGFRHTHHELYPPTGLQHPMYRLDAP
jgi:RimJ/RimL family protein N-acetyltransferase